MFFKEVVEIRSVNPGAKAISGNFHLYEFNAAQLNYKFQIKHKLNY
jgi:hypothetical protein